MNQEQNNVNVDNFNNKNNDNIYNGQPLNNQVSTNEQSQVQNQSIQNFQQQTTIVNMESPANTLESDNAINQSFNNKPSKKLILGLIIGVVVICIAVIIIFVNVISKKDKSSDVVQNENSNIVEAGEQDNDSKNKVKYESTKLKIVKELEKINGNIKDVDLEYRYILTNNDDLYDIQSVVEKKLKLPKSANSILDNFVSSQTSDLLIKNEDGSISHVSPYSSKINYTINLENVIYADNYNVITLESGNLYNYKIDNNNAVKQEKITLYKIRKDFKQNPYEENAKVTLEYLSGDSSIFLKVNDKIRQYENFMLGSNGYSSRRDSYLTPHSKERMYLEGKENLRMLYYSDNSNEIYVSQEKDSSIYYFDTSSFKTMGDQLQCIKDKGSEALCYESIKNEIALPENYVVNNIKETRITSNSVKDAFNLLIIMDDMKVFYYDETWKEFEELSDLYKNKHIVKLVTGRPGDPVMLLCDDGYIYEYSVY